MAEIKKEYLNIWEQVEKNKNDIVSLVRGAKTLADFGIKVIGYVSDPDELPDPDDYLQDGGEYGDAFAIAATEEPPYEYYVFTRPFEGEESPQWFNIGEFPKAGPQGPAGQDGEQGERGERGLTGPQGPKGATGNTGATGPAGPAPAIGENGNWYRDGVDTGLPSRGPQGEQGEPGTFFHIKGQVDSEDLLPDASEVDIESAYCVGTELPYDVYAIMDVAGTHYWINLGPVAVVESDTKVGSLTFNATGTLSADVLNAIANTTTLDCLKIGDRFFVKQSAGNYYALKRDSGQVLVYCMAIDMATGEWVITTETMVDLDSAQTVTGVKKFDNGLQIGATGSITGTGANNLSIVNGTLQLRVRPFGDYVDVTGLSPITNGQGDVGRNGLLFNNGYFAGQVYAENTFNVINASDIVNNTLTQEQYDLITNKKPTLIKGNWGGFNDLFLLPPRDNISYFEYWGFDRYRTVKVNVFANGRTISSSTAAYIQLQNIDWINGKALPAFPTTNTSPQVLSIGANGGALSFVQTTATGWVQTDNNGSFTIPGFANAKSVSIMINYQGLNETFNLPMGEMPLSEIDSSAFIVGPRDPEVLNSYWFLKLDTSGNNIIGTIYTGSTAGGATHVGQNVVVNYVVRF